MHVILENKYLSVSIKQRGAELSKVFNKETQLEYMWSADPAFWGKTSPVLFPIVGTLKDDTFIYDNQEYAISRHGFARDFAFELEDQKSDGATFLLKSNEFTLKKYPFAFELRLKYKLDGNAVCVSYDVRNADSKEMYFSIGAHPAFSVPLVKEESFEDYYLEFSNIENAPLWPINKSGLIESISVPLIENSSKVNLSRALFSNDALVFKNLMSNKISIKSSKTTHGLTFHFDGFPYMGIWSAKNADFVCIEPWCGIADSVNHNQQLIDKEGIQKIQPKETWLRTWTVEFY